MKTVKVKIAVAVDPTGYWAAFGDASMGNKAMMDIAVDSVELGEARYYLIAELAVPETKEIQAEIASEGK
jgi:hypothetical protein